jgi:hypothetical protein
MFPDDDEFEFVGPDRGWNYEPSRADVFREFTSPVYTTDAEGWLTYYNEAAADLWGYHPELGKTRWCGSWRILTREGAVLPFDQCPMAVAIKERRPVRGVQVVLERPDGTCIPFTPYPTPLFDASGKLVAASNVLLRTTRLKGPNAVEVSVDHWSGATPVMLRASLELDDLTGALQTTLAALADVEFGYQIDCERLEGWSGSAEEKERILHQLEQKRQQHRAVLDRRAAQLQLQARRLIGREPITMMHRPARVAAGQYRVN